MVESEPIESIKSIINQSINQSRRVDDGATERDDTARRYGYDMIATCSTSLCGRPTTRGKAAKKDGRVSVRASASCDPSAQRSAAKFAPREIAQVSAKKAAVVETPKPVVPTPVVAGAAVAAAAAAVVAIKSKKSAPKKQRRIVIAGAPASGKGTQCELIVKKFGLTHISAGDLLRAAVAEGTPAGLKAKEYMDRGDLVPNEVVVTMVKDRLAQPDCTKGWLLDGYPRSEEQAEALIESGIQPDLFLLLDVPDEILIDRVVGRRLDPVDGTIYHMTFFPPPNAEVAARLTQRSDDTEEKAANRLAVHHRNVDAVVGKYEKIMKTVDGNRAKTDVFADIERIIKAM